MFRARYFVMLGLMERPEQRMQMNHNVQETPEAQVQALGPLLVALQEAVASRGRRNQPFPDGVVGRLKALRGRIAAMVRELEG